MKESTLGTRIAETRKEKHMTQEMLAEHAGISQIFISEIERGIKLPSLETFVAIVEVLGTSADYLLRDEIRAGEDFVFDELTKKLSGLTPRQRKAVTDIVDAYLRTL